MPHSNRREILRTGAALSAGIFSGAVAASAQKRHSAPQRANNWEREYTHGHTILFMDEYHQGAMEILGRLSGELDHIGELSSRAATAIKNCNTVYYGANTGHMASMTIKEGAPGNPNIMKDPKEMDALQKGDMLFTCSCNNAVKAARDRGVYVVAVTVNYVNNEFRPEGFSNPNEDNLMLNDVSNDILHSHVPYYQGLVHAPEIPEITLCPSTIIGLGTLFQMMNAEIAQKLNGKKPKTIDKSAHFLRIVTERTERVKEHMDHIRETAVTMARRIKAGGTWFAKSPEQPGIVSDLHWVECGPMIVNRGKWVTAKEKNVMLICSISPAYPEEMKLALDSQIEGAYVIGVGPKYLDGVEPDGGKLIDVADAGFDNFSPESGVFKIRGIKQPICPTGGIIDNIIQQMICAQWTDEMVRRGSIPYYFKGISRVMGREFNNVMLPYADAQGF